MQAPTPITLLTTNLPMHPGNLRKLRGAVVEHALLLSSVFNQAGINTDLFHNHDESQWKFIGQKEEKDEIFRYPLIQYKVRKKRAAVLGLGAGAKALQLWRALTDEDIRMAGKFHYLGNSQLQMMNWRPSLNDQLSTYRLNKWLPFSPKNYERWQNTPKLKDKAELLDKVLWGHLHHMLEGLEFSLDRERLQLYTRTIDMQTYKTCFGVKKLALDITFNTNLSLPEDIGLGQGITIGFGKVQPIRNQYGQ